MNYRIFGFALCLAGLPLAAQAQEASQPLMPANGVFIGAGAALNKADFGNQDLFGFGVSDVYALGFWVANGQAAGSTYPDLGNETGASFVLQGGFYRTINDTPWVWGAKFSYNNLGLTGSRDNILIPQTGSYSGEISGTFNGNYLLQNYKVEIEHQFALVPLIGYSFGRGFVYGGAGPTLSRVNSNMNGLIGFAELDHRYDVSGTPGYFSSSDWVWGGTATVGVTYFLTRNWFLDLNYSYTASSTVTNKFLNQFDTVYPTVEFSGTSGGTYSATANNQAVALTINYVF